jgi:hypothetical protein
MVDNMNPTNQFHPYVRETSVPVVERPQPRLLDKVRAYVKNNPAIVLSGLAAVAITLGLMRARRA